MDLDIVIDRRSRALLSHQIGRSVVTLIASGALKPGTRLPATRVLAQRLAVARMTVVEAYDWLAEQGFVEARHGSGTVVREVRVAPREPQRSVRIAPARGMAAATGGERPAIDFRPGLPDLRSFPRRGWIHTLASTGRRVPDSALGYGEPLGDPELRSAIAAYLHRSRGYEVDVRNIVITAGTAQAVDLLLRTLPEHREIVIETPGPFALKRLPEAYGVTLRKVRVDQNGLRTDLLSRGRRPRLAYVVPSHQFPLGCVMSVERRVELIDWAARTNAYVIEDDYDSEFAFNGRPALPLARLDAAHRVIYACTFSKTLAPALRMGFMVVPDALLTRIYNLKWWIDRGGWVLQQKALARWIENGVFEQHVHRMRKLYRERFELLTQTLSSRLGSSVRFLGQPVGMHLAVLIRTSLTATEISARAGELGVGIYPIDEPVYQASRGEVAFTFGFGNVETAAIRRGIDLFASAL